MIFKNYHFIRCISWRGSLFAWETVGRPAKPGTPSRILLDLPPRKPRIWGAIPCATCRFLNGFSVVPHESSVVRRTEKTIITVAAEYHKQLFRVLHTFLLDEYWRQPETIGDNGRQPKTTGYYGRQLKTTGDNGRQQETPGDNGRQRETMGAHATDSGSGSAPTGLKK